MRKQQEAQHKEGDSPKAKEQEKAAAPNQPPKLAEAPKPPSLPTGPASLPANPNIPARPPPPAFNVRGSALGLGAANKILGAAGLGGDGGAGRRRDSREGSSSGPPRGEEGRGGSRDSRREGGGEDREQGRKRNLAGELYTCCYTVCGCGVLTPTFSRRRSLGCRQVGRLGQPAQAAERGFEVVVAAWVEGTELWSSIDSRGW